MEICSKSFTKRGFFIRTTSKVKILELEARTRANCSYPVLRLNQQKTSLDQASQSLINAIGDAYLPNLMNAIKNKIDQLFYPTLH